MSNFQLKACNGIKCDFKPHAIGIFHMKNEKHLLHANYCLTDLACSFPGLLTDHHMETC